MKQARHMFLLLLLGPLLAGCMSGVLLNGGIYSHTVEPLTFNKYPTEVMADLSENKGEIMQITFNLSVLWGTNGIGNIAREKGMGTVHYADRERYSILFGLWQEDIVHVYGR